MVYAESYRRRADSCFAGESTMTFANGALGLVIAYPGTTQITAPGACAVVPGANGTITIDVPLSLVSLDPGRRAVQREALQRHGEHDDAAAAGEHAVIAGGSSACRST